MIKINQTSTWDWMALCKMGDVCRNVLSVSTVYLNVCSVWNPGVHPGQPVSQHATLVSAVPQCTLFEPVHSGKERVGFDIIHTSHTCPQSLHWIVLEQLHERQGPKNRYIISLSNQVKWQIKKKTYKSKTTTTKKYHKIVIAASYKYICTVESRRNSKRTLYSKTTHPNTSHTFTMTA